MSGYGFGSVVGIGNCDMVELQWGQAQPCEKPLRNAEFKDASRPNYLLDFAVRFLTDRIAQSNTSKKHGAAKLLARETLLRTRAMLLTSNVALSPRWSATRRVAGC